MSNVNLKIKCDMGYRALLLAFFLAVLVRGADVPRGVGKIEIEEDDEV